MFSIRHYHVLVLVISLLCAGPATAKTLQGTIEHSDHVDALPSGLRQGRVFQEPRQSDLAVEWFRVPEWLVGQWRSNELRTISCIERGKGETLVAPVVEPLQSREQFGTQTDRRGQVWSDLMFPRNTRPQKGQGFTLNQLIVEGHSLESSKERLVLYLKTRNWRVDNGSGRIVEAFQGESINTYTALNGNKVLVQASNRKFDQDGNALATTVTRNVDEASGPFSPVEEKRGVNLRQSLSQYLKSIGQTELAPDAL